MTTSADVRTAWDTFVFDAGALTTITSNAYAFDARSMAAKSDAHNAKLLYNQKYNFFQYRVAKIWNYQLSGQVLNEFRVYVEYYREADVDGTAYNAVEDAFETIHTTVRSGLGETWNANVDNFLPQTEPVNFSLERIGGRPVWKGSFVYQGFKTSAL